MLCIDNLKTHLKSICLFIIKSGHSINSRAHRNFKSFSHSLPPPHPAKMQTFNIEPVMMALLSQNFHLGFHSRVTFIFIISYIALAANYTRVSCVLARSSWLCGTCGFRSWSPHNTRSHSYLWQRPRRIGSRMRVGIWNGVNFINLKTLRWRRRNAREPSEREREPVVFAMFSIRNGKYFAGVRAGYCVPEVMDEEGRTGKGEEGGEMNVLWLSERCENFAFWVWQTASR